MENMNIIGPFVAVWILLGNLVLLIDAYVLKTVYASSIKIFCCIVLWPVVIVVRGLIALKIIHPDK